MYKGRSKVPTREEAEDKGRSGYDQNVRPRRKTTWDEATLQ